MPDLCPQMWAAGVDYVRLTWTGDRASEGPARAYARAVWALGQEAGEGATEARPWSFQGYSGESRASASWGERADGCILQVSGPLAHSVILLDVPYTGVPRLDVEITTWGEASPDTRPRAVADESDRARRLVHHRPWKVRLEDGKGDGDTAYIGSRSSSLFIRVYDKQKESKGKPDFVGAVRYEAEYHEEEAVQVWAKLGTSGGNPSACAALVRGALHSRGVLLPEWVQVPAMCREVPRSEVTSTAQSVEWLRRSVRPTLRRLEAAGLTRQELWDILFATGENEHAAAETELQHMYERARTWHQCRLGRRGS
jgi:hypothetical protein